MTAESESGHPRSQSSCLLLTKQTFGRLSPVRIRLGINCPFRTTLTPNSIFNDADMPPAAAAATIQLWKSGTLSKRTHQKLAKGRLRTLIGIFDAEQGEIDQTDPSGNNPDDDAGD